MSTTFTKFHEDGSIPAASEVFVFGSNLAGRHGAGAAHTAKQLFGAIYGQGAGRMGMSYGIPTKGRRLEVLPLKLIRQHVDGFLGYARLNPELSFFVTRIGCGRAGYDDAQIAPLFSNAPSNCSFAHQWRRFITPAGREAQATRGTTP
ncbi:A1S_2505 family phage non-structural protein [Rubrivivax gelatinosus]|uniref:A1S_2505 family phage non-structural protein n=1 Tax=Rubrivivax gelatinosus TaxID=28068 RepID=UPI0006812FB1|nr:hypothetical protein [Rubrivivax gelatinosus]MBG6083092.1 hypothetical protein [Rubrivivax gelatinosus]